MRRVRMRELSGWAGALALALMALGQVASTPRAELLFRDGDSLIVALLARSVLADAHGDWAMSSVLFLPESAVFTGIDALLPLDANGLLAVNAVLNMLALYGALRLAAGRRRDGTAPVAWSLVALAAFAVLAMTGISTARDALELASLQLTTTYYAATVVAVVVSAGLVRRVLDRTEGGTGSLVALGATATLSTLTNPLYAAWATVPIGILLVVLAARSLRRGRVVGPLAALLGGTVLGFLGRIPFGEWIANTGASYVQPQQWAHSLEYYAGLLAGRLSSPLGVVACGIVVALIAVAVLRTARAVDLGGRFTAAVAWFLPVLVVVGAIALGTHAARYLQPLAFAPLLGLVAAPRAVTMPRRAGSAVVAGTAALLLAAGVLSVPRIAAAASMPDPDLRCVTDWVNASGRTGAGQFWTVRLPKLHVDDPASLVQVDHELNGYAWLVDRHDFDVGEVSFLLEDAQTVPWHLPVPAIPDEVIDCGRYRILDFGDAGLPLGPPRS